MPEPSALGPYVVLRRLGAGGMGTVYLCEQGSLGRRVAVKVPHAGLLSDREALRRFQREAQVAAGLDHPHVVVVYDAALDLDPPYLAMQLVDGPSLRDRLRDVRVLSLAETAELLRPIAEALDHVHAAGHTHRDVKPGNILLGRRQDRTWPYLSDFGLVRPDDGSALSSTGALHGTAPYLSPEQVRGQAAGPASDLYALACVAYECLTGAPPFVRSGGVATALAHRDDAPPRASSVAPQLPAQVDDVLMAALGKNPVVRRSAFPSVAAFVAALSAAGAAVAPTSRLEVAPAAVVPPRRSVRPYVAAAAVAVLGGLGAFVAADALVTREAEAERPAKLAFVPSVEDVLAPGAVLTDGQRALLEQAPLAHLSGCEPQPSVESATTSAAVGCESDYPRVDGLLLRQSTPGQALVGHMDSDSRRAGDCATEVGVDDSWAGGPLACYDNNRGVAALWWGYADTGLNWVAVRNDGDNAGLWAWFRSMDWSSPGG